MKTKEIIYLALGYVFFTAFVYLLFAFVTAEMNVFKMSDINRLGIVIFSFVYFPVYGMIKYS